MFFRVLAIENEFQITTSGRRRSTIKTEGDGSIHIQQMEFMHPPNRTWIFCRFAFCLMQAANGGTREGGAFWCEPQYWLTWSPNGSSLRFICHQAINTRDTHEEKIILTREGRWRPSRIRLTMRHSRQHEGAEKRQKNTSRWKIQGCLSKWHYTRNKITT